MATVWSPAPYIHKQEWLLSDGSIVTSPDFEATSSGRRIRVAGTTESFGNKQAEALMARAMDKIAADRGVTKVMRLYPDADADAWAAAAVSLQPDIFTKAVTLHMLKENHSSGYTQSTTALWKFKVKDMPVFAYVFISLNQRREHYTIVPRVVFRNTLPNFGGDHSYFTYDESNGAASPGFYRYSSEAERITEWMKNHFVFEDFQDRAYPGQMRTAVVRFAEMCKRFDDLQNIQVPDLRKGHENIETFDLERHVSNYSGSFHNELMSFVQTGPVLDRIKDAYQTLITEFRTLGLIVKNQADDSAIAQALNGDATAVKCTLEPNEDVEVRNDALDPYHTVTFDFASGTVVVNCTHSENLNEVAEAWDIAKFKAEMLGEEDVLMEYAKAYRNPKEQKRLLKIIGQRAVPDA